MSDEPASTPAPEPASGSRRQGRGVLCKSCEHLNPVGLDLCEYCEAPLFISCPSCQTVNPRVLSKCSECKSPLQQSLRDRLKKAQVESNFEKVREPAQVTQAGRGILCAKCEHLNPGGRETCEYCETELFVSCPKCSTQNVRALSKCLECKTPLHRSFKDRLLGRSKDEDSESTPSRQPKKVHQAGRGVLCSKCEHLNPAGVDNCEHCETELFIACPSCTAKNIRAMAVCTDCRKPLHRTLKNRFLGGTEDEEGSKGGKVRQPAAVEAAGRGILCAKCEHLNPAGLEQCEHCDSQLFINCPSCSAKNVRALSNCGECRTPLHRSLKDRILGDAVPRDRVKGARVPSEAKENGKGVLCAKCDHLNPAGIELCEHCNGHLYIVCRDCGHTNARVLPKCEKCNRRLHRSFKDRMRGGNESKPVNLLYVGIAAAAVLVVLVILVKMSGLRLIK